MANHSLAPNADARHHNRFEDARPSMAKADLNKGEEPWRESIGRVVARCFELAGVSQKEAADLLGGRDKAQIARWTSGAERPQFDTIFASEKLRLPLVIALAEQAGEGVEVTTQITVKRSA